MDAGFVRLSRDYFQSDLWKEPREFSRAEAWLDMIATATFAPEARIVEGRCLSLHRGEMLASLRYLSNRWSWSKSKVERFLSTLVAAERIRDRYETGMRILTLCNYERYNPQRDTNGTATRPPPGQSRDKVKEGQEGKEREASREVHAETNGAKVVVLSRELERIEAQIGDIRNSYDAHQTMDWQDQTKMKALKQKRNELRTKLGL